MLAVAEGEETAVGWVEWRDPKLFGRPNQEWQIGIILAPEHRGRGIGTTAQRLLASYLFDTSAVRRLAAYTEPDNAAEQRCLEKVGFHREGVLGQAGFRGGEWRDVVVFSLLREDVSDAE